MRYFDNGGHIMAEKAGEQDPSAPRFKESTPIPSDHRLVLIIGLSVFFCETFVMMIIALLPPMSVWVEALFDASSLVILIAPIIYFYSFRPLVKQITQRRLAEERLRDAHSSLEGKVAERTEELTAANRQLKEEIEKRKRAEEALNKLNLELEKRVRKRTLELRREIAERKRAEQEIHKKKMMLRTVFNGISDPLLLLNGDLKVQMLNEAAKDYFQVERSEDALDNRYFHALMGESKHFSESKVASLMRQNQLDSYERKGAIDPRRLEKWTVYPVRENGKESGSAILRISDITEEKLMERQLVQREKLASLGLLVSGIAHEINNPNTFITFNIPILRDYFMELLPILDDYCEDRTDVELQGMSPSQFKEDIFKILDNIEHGSTRINRTVSRLKKFVRKREKAEKGLVDLGQLTHKAVALCRGEIRKRVKTLDIDISDDLPMIYTDPEIVEQVLVNILINSTQAADKKDSYVGLKVDAGSACAGHLLIEVRDNGCGMDDFTKKKMFDPFFTTKDPDVGTGLGLYLCHNLVEGLGGRIEVESEPRKGSVFKVFLPLSAEKQVCEKEKIIAFPELNPPLHKAVISEAAYE